MIHSPECAALGDIKTFKKKKKKIIVSYLKEFVGKIIHFTHFDEFFFFNFKLDFACVHY